MLVVFCRLIVLGLYAVPVAALRIQFTRRATLSYGGVFTALGQAHAYDALPTSTGPDPVEAARRRKEREDRASMKNAEAEPLLARVRAVSTATEYSDAVSALTVWIIGTGPPIPSDGAAWGSTFAGPLPDGFKTRELVTACKKRLDELPRFRQEVGQFVDGVGACEATRSSTFCLSAGPLAESAFKAMLIELKRRAPRQYDTPYGPVAF